MKKLLTFMLTAALLLSTAAVLPASAADSVDAAKTATPAVMIENPEDIPWEPAVTSSVTMDNLNVSVPSAILMEKSTGKILYENNSHQRLAPASVTKVMTILLVVEALEAGTLNLSEMVTTSSHAASMGGSQIFLEVNERMSLRDMLKSVIVASANDAAVALAEHLAGSEDSFVALMNKRAGELGMKDTHFSNCTGLESKSEHLTTAYDIALMSRELIKHDMIKQFTTIWMDTVRNGEFGLSNTNKLVRYFNGATGLKTGFTNESMYCLSATAEREGVEYIAVVMHAQTSDIRFEAAKTLLSYAFATYTAIKAMPEEVLPPIPVVLGKNAYVQPVPQGETSLLLKKTQTGGLTKSVELCKSINAPVTAGQELGLVTVKNGAGEILAKIPLVAGDAVGRMNWWEVYMRYLKLLIERSL